MPELTHDLPDGYQHLDDQITGPVLDAIVIHPRSHGRLRMPGEHTPDSTLVCLPAVKPLSTMKCRATEP